VGGGGVFAGGFVSVHAGDIPLDEVTEQPRTYLSGFDQIVALYRAWREQAFDHDRLKSLLDGMSTHAAMQIWDGILKQDGPSIYDASIDLSLDREQSGR
jgi:hypothetical protein